MALFEVQGQKGIRRQTGLEGFAAETMQFITDLSPVSWVSMHLFDEDARRIWLGSRGISARWMSKCGASTHWRIRAPAEASDR